MDVFFSTIVRGAPIDKGGEVVKLEWDKKKIFARVPIAPYDPYIQDPNPRGSSRGGRGILVRNNNLYVANYHSLLIFNLNLEYIDKITNNLLAGIHEVCQTAEHIWVASTSIDAAIGLDETGSIIDSYWPRENEFLKKYLSVEPLYIDKNIDNRAKFLEDKFSEGGHVHLNAVSYLDDQLYILLNRYGVIYNTATEKILIEDKDLIGAHNLKFTENYLLTNNTKGKTIHIYTHDGTFVKQIDLLRFDEIKKIYNSKMIKYSLSRINRKIFRKKVLAQPLFLRGLSTIPDNNHILVGFSPATIVEIDVEREQLIDIFQFSRDPRVCIHGLLAWSG